MGVISEKATREIKKANRLLFINARLGDHILIPKMNIIPNIMVENVIMIEDVINILNLSPSGKKRIMD